MNDDSTFSSVVLPDPVPPLTTTLRRDSTLSCRNSSASPVSVLVGDQLVGREPAPAKAADREQRTVEAQRRDHAVDARAVGQPRVRQRARPRPRAAQAGSGSARSRAAAPRPNRRRCAWPRCARRARRAPSPAPLTMISSTARVLEQRLERPQAHACSRAPARRAPRARRSSSGCACSRSSSAMRPRSAAGSDRRSGEPSRASSTRRRRRPCASSSIALTGPAPPLTRRRSPAAPSPGGRGTRRTSRAKFWAAVSIAA